MKLETGDYIKDQDFLDWLDWALCQIHEKIQIINKKLEIKNENINLDFWLEIHKKWTELKEGAKK